MKTIKKLALLAIACGIIFSINSCGDDEPTIAFPEINLTEVGHDNSKHAHPGHDLHLEAEIVAEGLINGIHVEIEQVGGTYKIKQDYLKDSPYLGVKNCDFHEHIDIPANAPLGAYKLYLTVADKVGQQTTVESDLELEEGDDNDIDHEH